MGEYPDKRNSLIWATFRKLEKKRILMDSLLPKSKVCTGCGEEKLLGEFHKNKKAKYGREPQCKLCKIKKVRQYRETNKEKIAERSKIRKRRYYQTNKEHVKEYSKQYYQANKEKRKAVDRDYISFPVR